MLFTVICVQVTAGIYWHNAVSLWSPIHGVEGVQTVGRKTSWTKDVWANYFLGDRRLGDNSHFKKDVSPKDGWATKACIIIIIIIIIFFNIKLTNAIVCTIIKQMEQSIYKMQSI